MGQDQHNLTPRPPHSTSVFPPRRCLRQGCEILFPPRRFNQRYCQDPECLKLVRRWQAAKRQQQRRSRPEVRRERAAAARRQRAERPAERHSTCSSRSSCAWSRRARNSSGFCDRPGCYEPPQSSRRSSARYCGDECRQAMRRVRDRERKWLNRRTKVGRYKRQLEYATRRAARRESKEATIVSNDHHQARAVGDYRETSVPPLTCHDAKEVSAHDSEASSGARSRAPPTS